MAIRLGGTILFACSLAAVEPASACALTVHAYSAAPPGLSPAEVRRFYADMEADMAKQDAIDEALKPFREQKAMWENSEQVFVAQIESVSPRTIETFWRSKVDVQDVMLRPVAWLKGQGADQAFTIGISSWSDCGPDKRWDALSGKPGEKFVVFVEKGPPSNETVTDAIKWTKIVDPDVNIALAAVE